MDDRVFTLFATHLNQRACLIDRKTAGTTVNPKAMLFVQAASRALLAQDKRFAILAQAEPSAWNKVHGFAQLFWNDDTARLIYLDFWIHECHSTITFTIGAVSQN